MSGIGDYLQSGAFDLARGQYDSYELFIEVALRLLRDRGVFGYIIPDSITLPEHEPLRRMLLEKTSVSYLVRAGEGSLPVGLPRGLLRRVREASGRREPPGPAWQPFGRTIGTSSRRIPC